MIQSVLELYKRRFLFFEFYDKLIYNISTWPDFHIKSSNFLSGYTTSNNVTFDNNAILTKAGDIRVDLPVWFGNSNSKNKIVILGLEPRDTNKKGLLNIERSDKYVFATPFALERPKGPYFKAFQSLMNQNDLFVYFTDVVKEYNIIDENDKLKSDLLARRSFSDKAIKDQSFLLDELSIIKPDKVISLGNDSYNFLSKLLGNEYEVIKVRHPSQGGANTARNQLEELIK